MKILLNNTNIELFRTTHFYSWNFWHQFGWFPDREVTEEEITEILAFFEEVTSFEAPYENKLILDLDYRSLQIKINDKLNDIESDLIVQYVGERDKQNLYCSRIPTVEEEIILKESWVSMIKFE